MNDETRYTVLMIAPTPFFADRGCHVRIYEEARALVANGHKVHIITYHIGRDIPGISITRIPAIPWYKKLGAGPSWHKCYLDVLLFITACRAVRRFRPHLIHAHLHEGALVGVLLKMFFKLPLIFDYQGSLTGESLDHGFMKPSGFICRALTCLERFINRKADHIVTSSTAACADLQTKWGVPNTKLTPLTDGVDISVFYPGDSLTARRRLGIPETVFVVVYLGLLNRYQGIDLLLETICIQKAQGYDTHFLIMGFPDADYRVKAVQMGISGCITFTGCVDYSDAPFFLSAGDIAVSPKLSLTEANGKLLNYLACGLPTVAFDTPVNREILGNAACYAEYGSAESLSARFYELSTNSGLRRERSVAACKRASAEHSWTSRRERLEALYSSLLRSGA